jgi:hypothetical protein
VPSGGAIILCAACLFVVTTVVRARTARFREAAA